MVDVGGYKLRIDCRGTDGPAVILSGGLWVDTNTWTAVMPGIAKFARVCTYDRAGVGGSEVRLAEDITGDGIATELQTLLEAADVPGPYIIAGHSIAGLYIRLFQALYPGEVVGLVFVDGSHEDQFLKDDVDTFGDEGGTEVDLSAASETLREAKDLGDLPVVVLHGPLITGVDDPDFPALWLSVHKKQAQLSTNSMLVQATRSGHYIQETQPDVVIKAIKLVVDAVRNDTDLVACEKAFSEFDAECLEVR
jgi:pimeloyl-ACP methyl ester carboxylesterase